MKNLKPLLIPVVIVALVAGIFAFSTYPTDNDKEKKCKVKIVKIVNGEKVVIDSTFNLNEQINWSSSKGDNIPEMLKLFLGGDSSNIDIDIQNGGKGGSKSIKMKLNCNIMDESMMNMSINDENLEISVKEIEKYVEQLKEKIERINEESGEINLVVKALEDGKNMHAIKICKTEDEDGNIEIKNIIGGEEIEIEDEILKLDLEVDDENRKEKKHVVVVAQVSGDKKKEATEKGSKKKKKVAQKKLDVEQLNFSPNPNNGRFDLSFKLAKESPIFIKIVDLQGKEVYNEEVIDFGGSYNNNIDLSTEKKGVYILTIQQGNKLKTHKLVISH